MPSHNSDAISRLRAAYAAQGARGAVKFLNSLTEHRFTSLYRFDKDILRNLTFFDRQNPEVERCDDIPVEASYCVFVRDLGTKFQLEESKQDGRVAQHSKRDIVQRYCGVPLIDYAGKMIGSICHFDFEPGRISEDEVALLEYMAVLLARDF